jgi:hypothetical protein
MGYEAYKITAKFQSLTSEDMIGALSRLGAATVDMFGGTVTMEVARSNGVIKLILREDGHVNLRFSPQEKVVLTLLFPKTSRAQIAGDVIALLRTLAAEFSVLYIRDQETDRDIDPKDAAWLYQAVVYAKYDFEYHFPMRRNDVPSRAAFCPQLRGWPLAGAEGVL